MYKSRRYSQINISRDMYKRNGGTKKTFHVIVNSFIEFLRD